jgi:hypothetical protein
MAAIKVENYKVIADAYAAGQAQTVGVADYYYNAAVEVVMLQAFDPELDLLAPFYNAYLAARSIYATPPASIVAAVRTLQSHVLARARTNAGGAFTDINDWIDAGDQNGALAGGSQDGSGLVGREEDEDSSFTVPSDFATLSARAGYTIETCNQDFGAPCS